MTSHRNKDNTRERLLVAAASVFESQGYGQARLTDICRAVGVTKGALYCHFPSKEALALALLEKQAGVWHRQAASVRLRQPSEPYRLQDLIDVTYAVLADLRQDPVARAAHRVLFQDRVFDLVGGMQVVSCVTLVRDMLHEAQHHGELRRDVDLREAAEGIVGSVIGVRVLSRAMCDYEDVTERLETMWRMWVTLLAVPTCRAALRVGALHAAMAPHGLSGDAPRD
ncbi:ScbR family autoregulator-binding transcription factor [Allokutzneria oryzae]|uniref:ScbR family autoregulator-binding transcription factor n=1 Tax=Allokutzneria oryzae TaxID=1378989 RepID=A0ABV5ZXS4_9PSEU